MAFSASGALASLSSMPRSLKDYAKGPSASGLGFKRFAPKQGIGHVGSIGEGKNLKIKPQGLTDGIGIAINNAGRQTGLNINILA